MFATPLHRPQSQTANTTPVRPAADSHHDDIPPSVITASSVQPLDGAAGAIAAATALPQAGHIHIDRIRASAAFDHEPLGELLEKTHPDYGSYTIASEAVGTEQKRKYDSPDYFYARSTELRGGRAYEILFDCCPPKQLQKHNFFGHEDVSDYIYTCLDLTAQRYKQKVTAEQRAAWRGGQTKVHSLHLCGNFGCEEHLKLPIIQAIDENYAAGKHRDWETCLTLGFGMKGRSQNHTLTTYDKAMLLSIDWPERGPLQEEIMQMAKRSLRIEIKIYSQWLRTHGVDDDGRVWLTKTYKGPKALKSLMYAMNWAGVDIDALYFSLLKSYNITNAIQRQLTEDEQNGLSKGGRRAYLLWLAGHDLKNEYGRSTVHKYKWEVWDKFSVDITAGRRPERLPLVDLGELLVPSNLLAIPDWAYGTPRYWAPGTSIDQLDLGDV